MNSGPTKIMAQSHMLIGFSWATIRSRMEANSSTTPQSRNRSLRMASFSRSQLHSHSPAPIAVATQDAPTASWSELVRDLPTIPGGTEPLTPAEQAVAHCLRQGLSNREIAARLGMEGLEVADPYVERLLEGFAFLTARVQLKLEAEQPQLIAHLLESLYPNFLAPVPSMMVVPWPSATAKMLPSVER